MKAFRITWTQTFETEITAENPIEALKLWEGGHGHNTIEATERRLDYLQLLRQPPTGYRWEVDPRVRYTALKLDNWRRWEVAEAVVTQ